MTSNTCGVCLGNLNCLQGLHPVISCGIVECCSVGGKGDWKRFDWITRRIPSVKFIQVKNNCSLPVWTLMCDFMSSLRTNVFGQNVHVNGLIPRCLWIWVLKRIYKMIDNEITRRDECLLFSIHLPVSNIRTYLYFSFFHLAFPLLLWPTQC